MSMDAADVMNSLRVNSLKSIAKQIGIPKTVTRKDDLIAALSEFLKKHPEQFVEQLTEEERQLLSEAVYNRNSVSPVVFNAKYQVDCPYSYASGKDASLLHMVITRERYAAELEVPKTIADMLRPLLKKPGKPRPTTMAQVPEVWKGDEESESPDPVFVRPVHTYCGERHAVFELRRVMQLVQGGKIRIQPKSGRPTPASERAIASVLAAPDFDLEVPKKLREAHTANAGSVRAHAWVVLVQQCGWCKASGEALKLTKAGSELQQHLSESNCFDAYRDGIARLTGDDNFDELQRIDNIRGQRGNARRWMSKPSERREAITAALARLPINEWVELDEFYRYMNACGDLFYVTENTYALYFCEQRYGHIEDSDGLDRQYLRVLLMESVATLGVIDIAYIYPHYLWPDLSGHWGTDEMEFCGRYDGLLYVRLNPLGAYCLKKTAAYTPPTVEKRGLFRILPNRDIVIAEGHSLLSSDSAMLEQFAARKSDHLWHIDQQRILDQLESGGAIADIENYLTENSIDAIPSTVQVLFADIKAKLTAVVNVEEARLIEFSQASVATLVANDTKAGKLCQLAGERCVAVSKKNERAFRTAVKKLGYILP